VVGLPETKNQQGRNLTKHAGSVHAHLNEEEKNRKSSYEEGGDKQKKKDL